MFCGFQCINLAKINYDYFNGFRIVMEKPQYPCKFGAHLQTNLKEYEHYVGHLVDVHPESKPADGIQWVEYEIPIWLMMHNRIHRITRAPISDNFEMKGITLFMQKHELSKTQDEDEEIDDSRETLRIKKIDVIYNAEYTKLSERYTLPVFFKSTEERSKTFFG